MISRAILIIFTAGILCAQDTVMENNTIQFRNNPSEEKVVTSVDDNQAKDVVFSQVQFVSPNIFRFDLNIPCRALILLRDSSGRNTMTVFSGKLDQGPHRITYQELSKLSPGKYTAEFLVAPRIARDSKFGQNGFIQFEAPLNVCLNPQGDIFVNDSNNIIKLNPNGQEPSAFKKNMALLAIDKSGNIFAYSSSKVIMLAPNGEELGSFSINPNLGFACGAPGVYFARTGAGHTLWFGTGNPVIFTKSSANGMLGPVHSKYIGPSITADDHNNLYVANCFSNRSYHGAIAKYVYDGQDIRAAYHCITEFRDVIGLAASGNLVYAVERGTVSKTNLRHWKPDFISRLVQLFDNGIGLNMTNQWELPGVTGARALAIAPNAKEFYILEDTVDHHPGYESSLTGKGRLFKFKLSAAKEFTHPITIPGNK
jgi:hypothetical protein